jgi:hypothetical protein
LTPADIAATTTCGCDKPIAGSCVAICSLPLTNRCIGASLENLNPCNCEPVSSPCSHGATDLPLHATANQSFCPVVAGSGAGSAMASQGGKAIVRAVACNGTSKLSSLLNGFGTAFAGLFGNPTIVRGQRQTLLTRGAVIPAKSPVPSTTGFLLVLVIVGIILVILSFGGEE